MAATTGTGVEGPIVGDVGFIEGQGVLGEHHIAIDQISGCRDPGAIAKQAFLFDFDGAIGLHLVGTLLDARSAIEVIRRDMGDIKATFDIDMRVVLAHPRKNVFHVIGDDFSQAGDLGLQGAHRGLQERVQQILIKAM